ncbi:MAG: PQQ-dependent catabolism-associated CXXCW motif protein, partial [Hyphomicrobiales bacterium]
MTTMLLGCAAAVLCALSVTAEAAPDEPEGYRMERYRAEVPATLKGATVVGPAQATALWDGKGAIFVDVLPRSPRPAGLAEGTVWRPPTRLNIPG